MIFNIYIGGDTAAADVNDVTSISLYDANGNVVAGPADGVEVAENTVGTVTFSDTVTFPVGRKIYTLKGKIGTDFTSDMTVSASTTPSGWTTVKGVSTGQTVTPTPSSGVTASTMTIKGASLRISVSPTPVAQTVVRGVTGFKLADYIIDATGSGEDVRVTTFKPTIQVIGTANTADDLSNCQLWDGSTVLNTGSNVISPTNANAAGDEHTVNLDTGLTITKGTTKTLSWKCDIAANGTITTISYGLENTSGNAVATGLTSGQDITETLTASNGQTMTMTGAGSLAIALDSSSPALKLVNANTTGNTVTALKLTASNEDINVQQLTLQLSGTSSNTPQDVVKVTGWISGSSSQVGEAVFIGDYATMTLTGVTIPKNSDLVLTLKADIAQIGSEKPAKPGHTIKIDFDATDQDTSANSSTKGVGTSSGTTVYASGSDTASYGVKVFKAVPTVAHIALSTSERSLVSASGRSLYKFSISAPSTGAVGLYKFTFTISSTGAETYGGWYANNFKLYAYSDSGFSAADYNTTGLLNNGNLAATSPTSTAEIYFNPVGLQAGEAIQIPAGSTRYFLLKGTVNGTITSTSTLSIQLDGDAVDLNSDMGTSGGTDDFDAGQYDFATTAHKVNTGGDDDFIWSGNSTTTVGVTHHDWTNGYIVSGLPSDNLTSETLTQ